MSVRKEIEELIAAHDDDRELALALDTYSRSSWQFGAEIKWWGPQLYARNRRAFLPLIERWASTWSLRGTKDLEGWMRTADANGDTRLFRALYQTWLNDTVGWGGATQRWQDDFIAAFRAAQDRGSRRDVVEKYDIWYDIEDEFAAQLYRIDPVITRELVQRRLDRADWYDIVYEQTAELARNSGDEAFYFDLYRRTFPIDTWKRDVLKLAATVSDPTELCRELDRRHLGGPDGAVDPETLNDLLSKRGADVVPYLERRVADVQTWGVDAGWTKMAARALEQGFENLWAVVVRSQFDAANFAATIESQLSSGDPAWRTAARLVRLAGAQTGWREWRTFTALDEIVALKLYEHLPEICRGAFAIHLRVSALTPYLALAQKADDAGDTEMIDVLAAAAITAHPGWYARAPMENLNWYVEHFAALDPATFAARAIDVLGRVEPPPLYSRKAIRTQNPVYAAFFGDLGRYHTALPRVRDLLEAPWEDARRLGLSLLRGSDPDVVEIAVRCSDHLAAYLLDEATRATRIAAFEALAVAATHSEVVANDVLFRARAALDLRRKDYPRERLIELIGRIIHRWPGLRGAREQPVVFGAEVAW